MSKDGAGQGWLVRNRVVMIALAAVAAYILFVRWVWGWGPILSAWLEVGVWKILAALILLVGTYVIRTHRMQDYFPAATGGHFFWLLRVTQIHNLLNIMLPFRAGETSFPILMRSEFGVPLAQGASALVVLRLLDLHALLAAGGVGLVIGHGQKFWAWLLWLLFLILPLLLFPLRHPVANLARRTLPARIAHLVEEIDAGIPENVGRFLRAWFLTVLNWGVKVLVLAWVLALMGVAPVVACFGGALGGELSSVLPLHAPGGVGTYPAGIAAGATLMGADTSKAALEALSRAAINTHLLVIVSALAGTAISLVFPARRPVKAAASP